ncbi:Tyrosine-protein kinase Wzc [Candidatus Burkholderia brachyanthoides]|nr:Tyrosine-protein kinase Wzc [Candidatus Burkholderia brachyanthoides]
MKDIVRAGAGNADCDDQVDLRATADLLIQNRRSIVISTLATLLVAGLYLIVASPSYRANILVQVEDSNDDATAAVGNVIGSLASLFDVKSTDEGEMQVLQSRLVTERAADDLRLYVEGCPKRFPLVGRWLSAWNHEPVMPGLLGWGGYAWGDESIAVSRFDVPREWEDDRFYVTVLDDNCFVLTGSDLPGEVAGRVGEPLVIRTVEGLVTLRVTQLVGRAGVMFRLIRHSRREVIDELRKDLDIVEEGKDQSGVIGVSYRDEDPVKVAAVMNEIASSYVQQNEDRRIETANKSLAFLQTQLPQTQRQLEAAEDRLTSYQNRHRIVDLTEQAKALLEQSVQQQSALLQVRQKRTELLATLSERHPAVVAAERQITDARRTLAGLEQSLQKLPNNQQGLVRLMRDVRVETGLYIELLDSIQQFKLAGAGRIGSVRVIDRAVVPEKPVWPRPLVVMAVALVAGPFFGVAFIFTRTALAGGLLTDPVDVERKTLLDVIAAIPQSRSQRQLTRLHERGLRRSTLLTVEMPNDPTVEALRNLRTAVQLAQPDPRVNNVILITGPSPGTGKSFVAANLAILLGAAGKRVLLVDADMRCGQLGRDFSATGPGLSDVLRGTATLDSAISGKVNANVDLLGSGELIDQADDLLINGSVGELIERAARDYDMVVIDSPPVLPVADTTILASYARTVLLVARAGMTTGGQILESAKRLHRSGALASRVVLNRFTPGLRSNAYGNYRGYYRRDTSDTPAHGAPRAGETASGRA